MSLRRVVQGGAAANAPISALVVPLLAAAVFLNYADRGNLATAAPLIRDELHLSNTQLGDLLSAFFWTYAPAQLVSAWLVQRINAYRTLALGLTFWSVVTVATGFATGFGGLLVLRLLLGIGESVAFPCIGALLAQHLPAEKLGLANGISMTGIGLGPAFGTYIGGLLMPGIGWRGLFFVFGGVSLLWLAPWQLATRRAAAGTVQAAGAAPGFGALLRRRALWGTALGHFCWLYAFYFVISWLPLYFVKSRGFSIVRMGEIVGLIYVVFAASTLLTGLVSDRLIRAGHGASLVRKGGALASLGLSSASLLVAASGSTGTAIACLFCAGAAFGLATPNLYAIPQTLAGPRAAGKWAALQNAMANIAGIVAPVITGAVVDATGSFYWAFAVASGVALAGVIGWGLMIGEVAPLTWGEARP